MVDVTEFVAYKGLLLPPFTRKDVLWLKELMLMTNCRIKNCSAMVAEQGRFLCRQLAIVAKYKRHGVCRPCPE